MGNISSQIGNCTHKYKIESATQLSLPRINHQQKVLPNKEPRPKLRSTENGKILHAGGTLTGRHQNNILRGNFMSAKEKVTFFKDFQGNNKLIHSKEQIKKFGSEPDLRCNLNQEKLSLKPKRYTRAKKISQLNNIEKEQSQTEILESNDISSKRTGLFKTRIESKQHLMAVLNNMSPTVTKRSKYSGSQKLNDKRHSLPELQKDTPLLDYTNEGNSELCANIINSPEQTVNESSAYQNICLQEANKKKYYFGMESNGLDTNYQNCEIEHYKSSITPNMLSDEVQSNLSNNFEDDDTSQKIMLHLRPILPRKRLEIPKFSSSVAWKLLYAVDSDSNLECSTNNNDDDQLLIEERIEKIQSSPSRLYKPVDFQFSQDKSGDSGISGDETPKPTLSHYKSKQSWTPQQDLEDDSSTDEEVTFTSIPYYNTSKPHIFSLSLPRDHLTAQYTFERYKNQSNLQTDSAINKLKRSVSGIFSNGFLNSEETVDTYMIKNSNWLLSKSAPNSLNNGFTSLESTYMYNEALTSLVPVNSHHSKGRIMYLPHSDNDLQDQEKVIKKSNHTVQNMTHSNREKILCDNLLYEAEKKEQERLKEIEAMDKIEEEFRRKRLRYNGLYSNNQQDFRKILQSFGEKSV